MNLFLDSSALSKLYLTEPETATVMQAVQGAETVLVSTLALPETASALARKARDGEITATEERAAFQQLMDEWPDLERFDVIDHIAKEAATLARSKGLRGADAVQLATVAWLSRERKSVRFLAFDAALNQAARGIVKPWTP